MQSEDTILEALRAVRAGGDEGTNLQDFARFVWGIPRAKMNPRRRHCIAGTMLTELSRLGLVDQWGASRRGRARYTLTEAGEAYLRERSPKALRRDPRLHEGLWDPHSRPC